MNLEAVTELIAREDFKSRRQIIAAVAGVVALFANDALAKPRKGKSGQNHKRPVGKKHQGNHKRRQKPKHKNPPKRPGNRPKKRPGATPPPGNGPAGPSGGPVFDVTAAPFLAAKDGSTPVADAIQAAIDTATNVNGTVLFPPGTYLLEKPLELKKNVTLAAQTRRTATLKCEPVGTEPAQTGFEMLHGVDASNVTIRGLIIASTGDTHAAGSAIVCFVGTNSPKVDGMYTVSNLRVLDCEISGFKMRGVRTAARRLPDQGQFRNVQVSDCHIHHMGLMDDPLAFGLGVQPNGCDGATITGNDLHDIGKAHLHWGVYASDSRNVTIANNTMRRCAGGVAIAGDTVLDEIKILNNTIEEATSAVHLGLQLTGGAHCVVDGNTLRGAIIQAATRRSPKGEMSKITNNTIDLAQLGLTEHGAIFIGPAGIPAIGLLVQRNTIRNGRHTAFATADRGIRIRQGVDIKLVENDVREVYDGIFGFARTDLNIGDQPIQNLEITRNTISCGSHYSSRYIYLDNVQGLKITGNTGQGGTPAVGISIGGFDTANVTVTGNHIGPGPSDGPIRVAPEYANRSDIKVAPFVEVKKGTWVQK